MTGCGQSFFYSFLDVIAITNAIIITIKHNPKSIQVGKKTNHQDQSIIFATFKAIKTTCKRPKNPIPPLTVVLFLLLFLYIYTPFLCIRVNSKIIYISFSCGYTVISSSRSSGCITSWAGCIILCRY